jgi:hypothetical protein
MRLSPAATKEALPTVNTTPLISSYYLQESPNKRVGFLRVDMGGSGRWDRILSKCAEDGRRIITLPTWREAVLAGEFEITLATALPQKAERLSRALQETDSPLPIRIAVIPELLNLIAPPIATQKLG